MKKTNALVTFIDEKYIPLEKKLKIAIGVLLLILPVVLFWFFWMQPQQEQYGKLIRQKTSLTQELRRAKAKAAKRGILQAELKVIEERYNEIATLLPKEKEIPALLTSISALGRASGLDFLTFKPQKDVERDFYAEIPVIIKVRGPYHNMGVFLDQVSKLDRIVSVSNITMSGAKKEAGEMLLNSSCRLVTYRFTNKKLVKKKAKGKRRRRK